MEVKEKKILKAVVLELRHLLEGRYDNDGRWHPGDLEQRLAAIGIRRKHNPVPIDELPHLSKEDKQGREVVDAYLTLRQEAGIQIDEAVREFVRETAYTWANRLLALRCMEAREIIDEVILQKEVYGSRSLEHHRLAQRQPKLCTGEDDGLFAVFDNIFEAQAKRLPLLFDPKAPGVTLRPSPAALKDCIGLLSLNPDILSRYRIKISDNQSSNFSPLSPNPYPLSSNPYPLIPNPYMAPDALGWAYQYWNTEEKDRIFEKVRTQKGAKIEGADIIPATQLYTEPYMVKFLVQNSLGALWMEMHPDSKLYEQWEYYVRDADRAPVEKKTVREITFLDPACGSGHFLLEAFDLFYLMYEEEAEKGWGKTQPVLSPFPYHHPAETGKSILHCNLFGIDIDERAVQIAEAALWMKAAEKASDFEGVKTNLVAANICLPKGKDHLTLFLKKYPEDAQLRPALEAIFDGLKHVDELGSLLQIDELVEKQLSHLEYIFGSRKPRAIQKKLFGPTMIQGELPLGIDSYDNWKRKSLAALKDHFGVEAESTDVVEAFFSRSVSKGLALFELLSKKFDVVATNPPYLGNRKMGGIIKKYVWAHYPKGKADIYAAFLDLCQRKIHQCGYAAIVTKYQWAFASGSSYDLRNTILNNENLVIFVFVGPGGFQEISGEVVNVSLQVIRHIKPSLDTISYFIDLRSAKTIFEKSFELMSESHSKQKHYICRQKDFSFIPLSPLAFWAPTRIIQLFKSNNSLGDIAKVCQGLKTGNNPRFVRFNWEIQNFQRWYSLEKGGGYARYFSPNPYRIDYEYDGCRLKQKKIDQGESWSRDITNTDAYFYPGLTYSHVASGSLGVRLLKDSVFSQASPGILPFNNNYRYPLLGYLNTNVATFIARLLCPGLSFGEAYIARLPVPQNIVENPLVKDIAISIAPLKKEEARLSFINESFLDSKYLEADSTITFLGIVAFRLFLEGIINTIIYQALHLTDSEIESIEQDTGRPVGLHPLIKDYETLPPFPYGHTKPPSGILGYFHNLRQNSLQPDKYNEIKKQVNILYCAGPGNSGNINEEENNTLGCNDAENPIIGAHTLIPSDQFLEELSQKLQIHPISIYWLLKEGIEKEGWRCLPEEQRITADRFTVMILRLLGHRWPKQIEAGEPIPDWAIHDGIIPLTEGNNEPTLLARVSERIAAEFEGGDVSTIEREFAEIIGKPLDQWLETEFFKHHIKQFKKRPIAWQIQSSSFTSRRKPAFACLLYYHKVDGDILPKIRNQYIGPLRQRFETELRGIETIPLDARSVRQEKRRLELQDLILELKDFDVKLHKTSAEGFACKKLIEIIKKEPLDKWVSIDGIKNLPANQDDLLLQEQSYIPDINDGVRVNITPLQKAGLLASDVLAKKDIDKAIEDRAEWRADERRWCREGKLPQPGWWIKDRE